METYLINLLSFILSCYGMSMILAYGKIFDKIRPNYYYFRCTMCLGMPVGVFNWFLIDLPFNAFTAGCISAGTSYFISHLVDDDGVLIKMQKKE